uniref:Uncharacterized protein n=1 Tax=Rhizophora mucronata TaxID=61149 RepID=A0A2P2Q186_RHIMU
MLQLLLLLINMINQIILGVVLY